MADAVGTSVSVRLAGTSTHRGAGRVRRQPARRSRSPASSGRTWRAWTSAAEGDRDDSERRLPRLRRDQPLDPRELTPQGHTTSPPARYTEPSLVKAMEELGIGRPSTYASILQTIQDRGYVWKKGSALVPSWIAFAVVNLLEQHFTRLVDYGFTAAVEEDLDSIAGGGMQSVDWLTRFYFGSDERRGGRHRPGRRAEADRGRAARRHRRPRHQLDPAHRHRGRRGPGRPLRAVSGAGRRRAGQRAGGPAAGRAHHARRSTSCSTPRPGTGCSAPTRPPARTSRSRPAGTGRTCPRASGRPACSPRCRSDTVTLDEALRLLTLPRVLGRRRGRRGGHRAERAVRAVHQAGQGVPLAGVRGPAVHGDAGPRRSRCWPSRRPAAAGRPRRPARCASSATTRPPASRSSSGRAGSGRT